MNYQDVYTARIKAEEDIRIADGATRLAAQLIAGRLRIAKVPLHVINQLKRELKSFNMQTGKWSDK